MFRVYWVYRVFTVYRVNWVYRVLGLIGFLGWAARLSLGEEPQEPHAHRGPQAQDPRAKKRH